MPQDKDLKRLVRARMAQAGERYTQALTHVLSRTRLDPLPAPWFLTGSRAPDLGRRIRFSATVRAREVTGWAGLWLRIDGPRDILMLDNMQDRPLRQTTDWTETGIVLDVPEQATELHFGVLVGGAGAVDLTQPQFGEAGENVPVTAGPHTRGPLPDQPQASTSA